jgi:hypothetical protein
MRNENKKAKKKENQILSRISRLCSFCFRKPKRTVPEMPVVQPGLTDGARLSLLAATAIAASSQI